MPPNKPKISIVGAGAVGSVLAHALADADYSIVSVISRTKKHAETLANAVQSEIASDRIEHLSPQTEILMLSLSDDALSSVIKKIASSDRIDFKKLFAFHTSGVHPASILSSIESRDALIASIHPVQTFPAKQKLERRKLHGIYYGIEGSPKALDRAQRLVYDLGGKFIIIPPDLKPLYHIACVFSSNYLTVFLNGIKNLSYSLNFNVPWHEVFGPLMMTTLENVVKSKPEDVLTGPITRGDVQTIEKHLAALEKCSPKLQLLYSACGIEAAEIALKTKRITAFEYQEFIDKFRFIIHSSITKEQL